MPSDDFSLLESSADGHTRRYHQHGATTRFEQEIAIHSRISGKLQKPVLPHLTPLSFSASAVISE